MQTQNNLHGSIIQGSNLPGKFTFSLERSTKDLLFKIPNTRLQIY